MQVLRKVCGIWLLGVSTSLWAGTGVQVWLDKASELFASAKSKQIAAILQDASSSSDFEETRQRAEFMFFYETIGSYEKQNPRRLHAALRNLALAECGKRCERWTTRKKLAEDVKSLLDRTTLCDNTLTLSWKPMESVPEEYFVRIRFIHNGEVYPECYDIRELGSLLKKIPIDARTPYTHLKHKGMNGLLSFTFDGIISQQLANHPHKACIPERFLLSR